MNSYFIEWNIYISHEKKWELASDDPLWASSLPGTLHTQQSQQQQCDRARSSAEKDNFNQIDVDASPTGIKL